MGFIPPPIPLTKKEFDEAIANGSNTMAEIDPSFAKWFHNNMIRRDKLRLKIKNYGIRNKRIEK